MDKDISPAKTSLHFALMFGVIMVFEFVIMYAIGIKKLVGTNAGLIVNLLNYIILPLMFIYLGCNNYKKNINRGYVSMKECLKIGISILFIGAFIFATFNVIFNLLFPEFINELLSISKEAMIAKNPNLTSAQVEADLYLMRKFLNPLIAFPVTLAMYSFFGLIYSLIMGAILKNDNPHSI